MMSSGEISKNSEGGITSKARVILSLSKDARAGLCARPFDRLRVTAHFLKTNMSWVTIERNLYTCSANFALLEWLVYSFLFLPTTQSRPCSFEMTIFLKWVQVVAFEGELKVKW